MSERAEALAAEFEQTNRDVAEVVGQLSDDQWATLVPGENWPVGVVVRHIASSHELIGGWVRALADGQALQLTHQQVDELNAAQAREHAACTKPESLALLRRTGEAAARLVRELDDDQLDRRGAFFERELSAGQVVERVLIGHPRQHLASIRAALGQPA